MNPQTTTPGPGGDRASKKSVADWDSDPLSVPRAPGRINTLLDRLEGVKANGRDRWMVRCPAHDDRSPSLSIRETGDRVLVHCFAGCGAADVVAAVGLELTDLFPEPLSHHRPAPRRQRIPAGKVLDSVSHALTVVTLADCDLRRGKPLSDDDREAVDRALTVLNRAKVAA